MAVARRTFIASATAALAAETFGGHGNGRMRIGFQVFAVRDLCERDFPGTLKAAKAMGYEGVETGRFYGRTAQELKALVGDAGLELFALQLYPHNLTEPQLGETIRFCETCACKRINVAWYCGSEENLNDWQLMINVLNHAADVCAENGISVAYHNHDHEFRMKVGGRCLWDWLWNGNGDSLRQVTGTPRFSSRVQQELDCGNCLLGGSDPVEWITRFPGRIPTVHLTPAISDFQGLKPGEAGLGSSRDRADWPKILTALRRCGTEWLTVKPTGFPGDLADLKSSRAYLKSHGCI